MGVVSWGLSFGLSGMTGCFQFLRIYPVWILSGHNPPRLLVSSSLTVWEAGVIISASVAPKGHLETKRWQEDQNLDVVRKKEPQSPASLQPVAQGCSLQCDLQRLGGTVLNRRGSAQTKGLWLEYAAAMGARNGDRFLDCGNPKGTECQRTAIHAASPLPPSVGESFE